MDYIGLAIPCVALGTAKLFADSGFLCLYEPLVEVFKRHGHKSVVYIDKRYKKVFEEGNNPSETGVYGVYSQSTRNALRSADQPFDDVAANTYLDGLAPVDYVLTNKPYVLPHLAAQSLSPLSAAKPVVYICLNAGKDGVPKPIKNVEKQQDSGWRDQNKFYLYMEAATMLTADYSIWTTETQRLRALAIARRFLAPATVLALKKRSMVNGCGISNLLRPYAKSDVEVAEYLKSDKTKNFGVEFIGRVNRNKNVIFILNSVRVLFAKYGLRLSIKMDWHRSVGDNFANVKDVMNVIDTEAFREFLSREEYASKRLPSCKCMIYASIAEGYAIVPREALYIGVPVMLPDRPWAIDAVGPEYPFLYKTNIELIAHIKRLRDGRITDDEVERFLAARRRPTTCEFLSDVSEKLFQVCKGLVDVRYAAQQRTVFRVAVEAFKKVIRVGDILTFKEIARKITAAGVEVGIGRGFQRRVIATDNLWMYLKCYLRCIDPAIGSFERIK